MRNPPNIIWRALGEVERKPIDRIAYWLRRLNRSWEKRK